MNSNTFGRQFRVTTFGESHGPALGGVVDGCPAGLPLCAEDLQRELDLRKPGADGAGRAASTARREPDIVRILSGVFDGMTTGSPIAFVVENTNQRSGDYSQLEKILRPGHADLGFFLKYGIRDHRGGGRSSGRETLSRVAGGAIALRLLTSLGIKIYACTAELAGLPAALENIAEASTRPYCCPEQGDACIQAWEQRLEKARSEGDTVGGLVRVEVYGVPAGLGEPVFDKLDARLAYAFMGVGAVKGIEIGAGFAAARMRGSENNDALVPGEDARVMAADRLPQGGTYGFYSNNAGGVLGGISSGAPLVITAAVKPIASIAREQSSLTVDGEPVRFRVQGRHDICAIPRIVPVLKAMTALTVADYILLQQTTRLKVLQPSFLVSRQATIDADR